jgi:hypothetical protein
LGSHDRANRPSISLIMANLIMVSLVSVLLDDRAISAAVVTSEDPEILKSWRHQRRVGQPSVVAAPVETPRQPWSREQHGVRTGASLRKARTARIAADSTAGQPGDLPCHVVATSAETVATQPKTVATSPPLSQFPEKSRLRSGHCLDFLPVVARSLDIVAISREVATPSLGNVSMSSPESRLPGKLRLFLRKLSRLPLRCHEIAPSRDIISGKWRDFFDAVARSQETVAISSGFVATCSAKDGNYAVAGSHPAPVSRFPRPCGARPFSEGWDLGYCRKISLTCDSSVSAMPSPRETRPKSRQLRHDEGT